MGGLHGNSVKAWYVAGMRKPIRVSTLSKWVLAAYLGCASCLFVCAENSSGSSSASMPTDPKELVELAARFNGLTGDGMRPWHLKASFELFDDRGEVRDHGTIEEFWAGQLRNRLTYTMTGFTQTIYTTDKGKFRSGSGCGDLAEKPFQEFARVGRVMHRRHCVYS
jgi:hypothetical protein